MKLTFLGTRGYIDVHSRRHRRHSALEVAYHRRRVMVDCGEDWLGRLDRLRPHGIVVTHAHPDHALGLRDGAPCPVYATAAAWSVLRAFPIRDRRRLTPGRPRRIGDLMFEAFEVEHSIRAPAVGYRITGGSAVIFYVPDLVSIVEPARALRNIGLYAGDGASLTRPLVRRRGRHRIGHAPVKTQLEWCRRAGVPRMIVTHCGTQIVTHDGRPLRAALRRMGREYGVDVQIAHDGWTVLLRGP